MSAHRNIPLIKPDLPKLDEVGAQFSEILENGKITNFSRYVSEFEAAAGAYLGAQAVTVSSGTMGLLFALQAAGLKKGEKVVIASFTFMATGHAVLYAGGIPIFAECNEDLTMSPDDLRDLLENHHDVGGVIATHAYGMPCEVDELQSIVDEYSRKRGRPIFLLYDAAHAFGSAVNGARVGTFGNAEIFSLSVTKALVCVEGGLVTSKNSELIERIRKMRNYGINASYNAAWPGMNGKMSEFHAIVGLHNLKRIESILAQRRQNAALFYAKLMELDYVQTMRWPEDVVHTFKDFTILMPEGQAEDREPLMAHLKDRGIDTRAYFFPPLHEQELFRQYADRPLPLTSALSRRVITLPFFTTITADEIGYIVDALRDFAGRRQTGGVRAMAAAH
jgi:dTDP-4-amino-4,6-dideoxygalactose transaminase